MYMAIPRVALDSSKLIILIIFDLFWRCEALGNMLTRIVSNSHFGKRPGDRDMTILMSLIGPHIPHIRFLEVCEGICKFMGVYGGVLPSPCSYLTYNSAISML